MKESQQLEVVLATATDWNTIWVYCSDGYCYEYDMTELRQAGGVWAPLEDDDMFANTIAFRSNSVVWLTSPNQLSCPDICLDVIVQSGRRFRPIDAPVFDVLLRSKRLEKDEIGPSDGTVR